MPEPRKSFSALKKLEIVPFAKLNGNREAGRHFEVNQSNIRLWRKKKPLLKGMNQNKRARMGRKECWPELEKELKIRERMEEGFRAKIIAQTKLIENFKASNDW